MAARGNLTIDLEPAGAYDLVLKVIPFLGGEVDSQSPPSLIKFHLSMRSFATGLLKQKFEGESVISEIAPGKSGMTLEFRWSAFSLVWSALLVGIVALIISWAAWGAAGVFVAFLVLGFQYWIFGMNYPDRLLKKFVNAMQTLPTAGRVAPTVAPAAAHTVPMPASPPSPAAAQGQGSRDIYAEIKKLGELRDAGILTPEEFEAKKGELLARI